MLRLRKIWQRGIICSRSLIFYKGMPKNILYIGAALAVILLAGWWYFSARDVAVRNYPSTKSGPVVLFGDSLAEGVGATEENDLASRLGKLTGMPVLNYGVSGDTSRDGLERLPQVLAEDPRVAIILLGGNDFLKKIPREETFQNLEKIAVAFQKQGAIVMVLGVRSGIIGGGADKEFEALAERTDSAYLPDVLSGVFAHPDLMSDAIHPNDKGYGVIAERIAPQLMKLLR